MGTTIDQAWLFVMRALRFPEASRQLPGPKLATSGLPAEVGSG